MTHYDIAVIGAGVVGCAVARELAGYQVSVVLIDERHDVGDATSKANTAILHTGFDAVPGSVESRLVSRGYHLLRDYADVVGIPIERTGALLVAWNDDEREALPALEKKARANGYLECTIIDSDEVYHLVPTLAPGALAALTVPDESIICPWTTPLAYATEALARGVDLLLGRQVRAISVGPERTNIVLGADTVGATWVVNAAGLGAAALDRMMGFDRFTVLPRRGELIVFDKGARSLVNNIVLPVPTDRGKGVLISPTIFGNVMLGPTAETIDDPRDTATTEVGLATLLEKGRAIMPALLDDEVTATYAGLRAATEHSDYVIECDVEQRYLVLGGIRSTGLTASMAIAEYASELLADAKVELTPRVDCPPPPSMPMIGEAYERPYQRAELIAQDAEYGHIVCFCERVTRGEIRDALTSAIPPRDADGLRRRTRALMGRCQGFYCGAEVTGMLEQSINERHGGAS